jgi:hypothetical protein
MEPEKSLLKEFINGGWVIPLIGAAAMIARLLSTDRELKIVEQFKKILSAAIASGISWFILEQTDISSLYKAITYGIIGVISPEIINGIITLGKSFEKNPTKYIKK